MGKGIPDIVAGEENNPPAKQMEGDEATTKGRAADPPPATPQGNNSVTPNAAAQMIAGRAFLGEQENGQEGLEQQGDSGLEQQGGSEKAGLDRRIHLLDNARRRMADAGATIAAACAEAKAAAESGSTLMARSHR